jgi:hypothetical protein
MGQRPPQRNVLIGSRASREFHNKLACVVHTPSEMSKPHTPTVHRVLHELCAELGCEQVADAVIAGARIRVEDCDVAFIHDEAFDARTLFVYIDLGSIRGDRLSTYEYLLALNTELTAGARGVMSLHPETGRILYSFQYVLAQFASGADLLDTTTRFIQAAVDGDHDRVGSPLPAAWRAQLKTRARAPRAPWLDEVIRSHASRSGPSG